MKPENIVLDGNGFLKLTDFGLSKIDRKKNNSNKALSGTPEYFAPEIVAKTGYGFAVDWWALGCLAFEMVAGFPPIKSEEDTKTLFDKIQRETIKMPLKFSKKLTSFVQGLLDKRPEKRMKFVEKIKEHSWLSDVNWKLLLAKKITPPSFKPAKKMSACLDDPQKELVTLFLLFLSNFGAFCFYKFCG